MPWQNQDFDLMQAIHVVVVVVVVVVCVNRLNECCLVSVFVELK
jgi:hypothetical protein